MLTHDTHFKQIMRGEFQELFIIEGRRKSDLCKKFMQLVSNNSLNYQQKWFNKIVYFVINHTAIIYITLGMKDIAISLYYYS